MKSYATYFFAVVAFGTFSGCAAMQADFVANNCNRDAAFEHGMNDARAGKPMGSYSGMCDSETQKEVREGYRAGYNEGIDAVERTTPGPSINVNIGGGDGGGSYGSRNWVCEIKPFTKTFRGYGASQQEARSSAFEACTSENHEMHCHDANCRLNQ